ncbi:MAG TPA: transketolase C-terminal domain-containing protein, partial [Candidatus Cryosericum sp.]|nr:transketolase C-terminal domain-containing protein [Candidatus Cryosericum sp.]
SGPFAVRYPKDVAYDLSDRLGDRPAMVPGTGALVAQGRDVALISLGPVLRNSLDARGILASRGIEAAVVDLRFARPLDAALLQSIAGSCRSAVVIEEATRSSGVYDEILELLVRSGMDIGRIARAGVPDEYPVQDKRSHLLSVYGMDAQGIAQTAERLVTGVNVS